jgi:hypothetical protein
MNETKDGIPTARLDQRHSRGQVVCLYSRLGLSGFRLCHGRVFMIFLTPIAYLRFFFLCLNFDYTTYYVMNCGCWLI